MVFLQPWKEPVLPEIDEFSGIRAGNHVPNRRSVTRKRNIVALKTGCVRVQTRHDRRTSGSANGLSHISVLENKALVGQLVEIRRFYPVVAVGTHRVSTLLIGEDE